MKKILFTLAITLGVALGGIALVTSNALACGGGKDKDTTSQQPTGSGSDSTQS
ncbi:MAG TPA: hypothetical protein VHC46_04420 [Thermodesulfobacteriota bacterium]|nr:hypothetical protein [Thermodesulfobacteriota bacterium]